MGRTVLIADEDVHARIMAETLLRLRGLRVRFAGDGAEASALVCHADVAVVVLDVDHAEMNGFELLRRLRGRFEALPLPTRPRVLAVTARRDPAVKRFALHLGADAVLYKPFAPARFIETAERLVRGAAPQTLCG